MKLLPAFWPVGAAMAAWQRVVDAGRLFATDNGGRQLYEWREEDSPDLWEACLVALGLVVRRQDGSIRTDACARSAASGAILAPYAIRYVTGVEVKPHSDSGCQRLILLARAAGGGGQLFCNYAPVLLAPGDALVFDDKQTHAVTRVVGERWVLTMGANRR